MNKNTSEETDLSPRPMRQEQEPASEEVTEIAKGIYRFQLPISMPGLGHVNCYALEDEKGLSLVDPGLPGHESWNALEARLKDLGTNFNHVHTAIVTHSHVDHYGGVHRLRDDYEVEVLTHSSFSSVFGTDDIMEDPDAASLDLADDEDVEKLREMLSRPTPWGTKREPPSVEELRKWSGSNTGADSKSFQVPKPSLTVEDSEEVTIGGRTWLALHLPGHTHDHLCLFDPVDGIFLSGDHVLPTITPHIGGMGNMEDPLAVFFNSLERTKEFSQVSLVLPAHGHPFNNLVERTDDIIQHHVDRLQLIRETGDSIGEASVNEYMKYLFKERSWGDMAASETYAHLEHLRILGEATPKEEKGIKTYKFA